jgi:phosphonate transport system substrate-binding protein
VYVLTSYADQGKERIKLAILPCNTVEITFKKFHPLVTHLQQIAGFDIDIVVPTDATEFERAIKNRTIDFVLQDPHLYLQYANLYNRRMLLRALNPDGTNTQSGVVIVRNDSAARSMKDLKGKSVMFGPTLSSPKWIAARWLFEESGVNIDKDLKAYSNGKSCEDIAFNVYLKAVDAGVVCDHSLNDNPDEYRKLGMDIKQLHAIAKTNPVPTRIFAARQEMNSDVVSKLCQALLSLNTNNPEHAKMLNEAELGGFQQSKDEDYDALRIQLGVK